MTDSSVVVEKEVQVCVMVLRCVAVLVDDTADAKEVSVLVVSGTTDVSVLVRSSVAVVSDVTETSVVVDKDVQISVGIVAVLLKVSVI